MADREHTMLRKLSRACLVPGLLSALLLLPGCDSNNDHDSTQTASTVSQTTSSDDGSLQTVVSALQEQRLTFNNGWTTQELDDLNISHSLTYQGAPFTTWKNDYDKKLAECTVYSGQQINGDTVCLPSKDAIFDCSAGSILEYGYYCGAGRPADGFWGKEPLDGVDYCCRMHDMNVWGPSPTSPMNACGAVMCLYYATEYPAGSVQAFPEVENARQCIFDWAKKLCGGIQPLDTPPPATMINP
jgi:hypothetical protein